METMLRVACGRSDPELVTILTGPSAGKEVMGSCGGACEGTTADTIGVYEFDTISKQIVGTVNIDSSYGYGANPVASPDGKYVLLLGDDGGKSVRVLQPRGNGEPSVRISILLDDLFTQTFFAFFFCCVAGASRYRGRF